MREDVTEKIKDIYFSALKAVNPYEIVYRQGNFLKKNPFIKHCDKIYAVSFGKAAFEMSRALEDVLGDQISRGIVITKDSHAGQIPLKHFEIFEASHPVPDMRGFVATQKVIELLSDSDENTLVICLVSGGGSALLVAPCHPVDLKSKQAVTELLLKSGADIGEINIVRKHLSAVKGGRLAEIAYPARIISLIISDVIGDDTGIIASGPTAPDPSTYYEALSILKKFDLLKKAPDAAVKSLMSGAAGALPETPKGDEPLFDHVTNNIVGNNTMAVERARERALSLGYSVRDMQKPVVGEARNAGTKHAELSMEIRNEIRKHRGRPVCLVSGGETTVTVKGPGKGGRNTEFALAFALKTAGIDGISLLSAGTDGTDGPTDAAGAFADGSSVPLARNKGIDPSAFLDNNDSYTFFRSIGDLFVTGPTGTNVMDLQIVIIE